MSKKKVMIYIGILLVVLSSFFAGYFASTMINRKFEKNQTQDKDQCELEQKPVDKPIDIPEQEPGNSQCTETIEKETYEILKYNKGRFFSSSSPTVMVQLDFYGNLTINDLVYARISKMTKNEDGSYSWLVYDPKAFEPEGNFSAQTITYYPAGVKIYQDGSLIDSYLKVDRFSFDVEIYSKSVLDQHDFSGFPD